MNINSIYYYIKLEGEEIVNDAVQLNQKIVIINSDKTKRA